MPISGPETAGTNSPFQAVLFDMDGVILDSEPIHEKALKVALDIYGISVPASASSLFRGLTERKICRMVVERWGTGQVDAETLMAAKFTAYADLAREVHLMPGVMDLIEFLYQKQCTLGLVTSAAKHDQVRAFEMFGLGRYFPIVVTAADITHHKPHPQPYRFAASRMRLAPENCLVIEDSKYGVASAATAGCTVIGFASGFNNEALKEAGARWVHRRAPDIELRLLRLMESGQLRRSLAQEPS